jgi:glycosyltransferase involved in cell wall biosynthesis
MPFSATKWHDSARTSAANEQNTQVKKEGWDLRESQCTEEGPEGPQESDAFNNEGQSSGGETTLIVPADDVSAPEISIVVPALDEELTIGDFVEWCKEGLEKAGVVGEVLIVDSSADRTAEIAVSKGARVLRTPKRGLGQAYLDAMHFIRGRFVIMGDADCTYDFRDLGVFVEKFHENYEFVMGSRWRGSIEPGSMPALHRYFGTPVTTRLLNILYSSSFSDIHCGMRGVSRDALRQMNLRSRSWEYASEMVLKAVRMGMRTTEVPVKFYKDREGRLSHHKRSGWSSPWKAGWINLRAMFVYGLDFFVLKPGLVLLGLGLIFLIPLSGGPITIGPITFSLYWMLAGMTLALIGLQNFYLGCLAQTLYAYDRRAGQRWLRRFPYTRTVVLSAVLFLIGIALVIPLAYNYVQAGLSLPREVSATNHLAITGIFFMIAGFTTFSFTLMLHAIALHRERVPSAARKTP